MQRKRRRRGFSLPEALIVIVVVGVLMGVAVPSYSKSQEQTRVSNCEKAITAYSDAFTNATMTHPGLVKDRLKAWKDPTGYSSEKAYSKLVTYINNYVEDQLTFDWDPALLCYKSKGQDPWGGHYILTEYPDEPGGQSWLNPMQEGSVSMRFSIWATGNSDSLLEVVDSEVTITEECYGAAFVFTDGLTSTILNNLEEDAPFIGHTLRLQ